MKTRNFFLALAIALLPELPASAQQKPLKLYISVDMEGIGGIGTPQMVQRSGKDYEEGRKLMTAEVNAVVEAIFAHGPAEIIVNDSHGDMQNILHTKLDARVTYIQGNAKPLGMMQGIDGTFDGVIFLGYHARAGTEDGFLAHTGSGRVKGLWINGKEVGEGGLNLFLASAYRVPVILASGDVTFTRQINQLAPVRTVATKEAIGIHAARLKHPERVLEELKEKVGESLGALKQTKPFPVSGPFSVQIKLADPAHVDAAMSIPGMKRIDGYTVAFTAESMDAAYRLIRFIYKNITWS